MSKLKIVNNDFDDGPEVEGESLLGLIFERYPDIIFRIATGYDAAVIGVDERTYRLIYSKKKYIELLAKEFEQDMGDPNPEEEERNPYEMALEYFDYNVSGAWIGDDTPIFCDDDFE